MSINRVQFQKGLSLAEFFERYGSEASVIRSKLASDSFRVIGDPG